jgi:hypothetical protein
MEFLGIIGILKVNPHPNDIYMKNEEVRGVLKER